MSISLYYYISNTNNSTNLLNEEKAPSNYNDKNQRNDSFKESNKNSDIQEVRNGYLKFDDSITVSDALDNYNYIKSSDWSIIKDRQNRKIVQYEAVIDQIKVANEILNSSDFEISLGLGAAFIMFMDKRANSVDGAKKIIKNMISDKSSIMYKNIKIIIQFTIKREGFNVSYIGIIDNNNTTCNLSLDDLKGIYNNKLFNVSCLLGIWSSSLR